MSRTRDFHGGLYGRLSRFCCRLSEQPASSLVDDLNRIFKHPITSELISGIVNVACI